MEVNVCREDREYDDLETVYEWMCVLERELLVGMHSRIWRCLLL